MWQSLSIRSSLIDYKLECKEAMGWSERTLSLSLIDYKLECKGSGRRKCAHIRTVFNRLQIGM